MTHNNAIVTHEQWTAQRQELLQKEKEFTRLRDDLSRQIRSLPWEKIEKTYQFHSTSGLLTLSDLFGAKRQLIVYHFMYDPAWEEGCKSCSIMTDSLNPCAVHLAARDVAMVLVSRAPLNKLLAFKERMGWSLNWVSSADSDFNRDFQVTIDEVNKAGHYYYNYSMMSRYPVGEQPGLSVFIKDAAGEIYHTYSTYARGLESFLGTYSLLDIVPKGRDEDGLPWPMEWIRHRDKYATEAEHRCH